MTVGRPGIVAPSISTRLGLASVTALGGALLLAVLALTAVEYINLRRALLADTRVEAQILAENISAAVLFKDKKAAAETLQIMQASPILYCVAVFSSDGNLFAAMPQTLPPYPLAAAPLPSADYRFSRRNLEVVAPVRHMGATIGYIYLNKTLARLYYQIALYGVSALGIGVVAMLLASLMMARVQRAVGEAEAKLHTMAHIDPLTGTWNRNTFNDHLDFAIGHARRYKQRVAVLLLDLDNFKTVNDTLGHQSGDMLLHIVARRLLNVLRQQDIVCRLGGDEFAIVLQHPIDPAALASVGEKVTRLFADPVVVDGRELHITGSLGMSIYPDDAADKSELIRNADTAMYQAKAQGKNTHQLFTAAMHEHVRQRMALESGLQHALANNELSLHYQPQFDLQTQKMIGLEVLLRWHSMALGQVSPVDFIPVAEDTGLIVPLGEWVLVSVCRQLREWRRRGFVLPVVAVNLSARQLRVPELAQRILSIMREHAIEPHYLELELTEAVLMENVQTYIADFSVLQAQGVRLSIDNFGTGYSSMAYLKRLPLHKIKIDRAFIRGLPMEASDCDIVAATIAMSHSLGLTVTAEGVENREQEVYLRTLGCDAAQGFYFGRPRPAEQLDTLLSGLPVP